jgi:hypothetical protein
MPIIIPGTQNTELVKSQLKTYIIKKFKDNFVSSSHEDVGFIFVGNSLPYANNDTTIPDLPDNVFEEKKIWDKMLVAKKITPSDIELVIDKNELWTSGRIYKQYDDIVDITDLVTLSGNQYPMYIMNSEQNVYKCLDNNNGALSINEPTGNYTISDGFIETPDGYIWRYMYNVKSTNKFFTNVWIPAPFHTDTQTINTEYDINSNYIIDGSLNKIQIVNRGNNYIHTTTSCSSFGTGSDYITVPSLSNMKVNMGVQGLGILPDTYITSLSIENSRIYISSPTTSSGGGLSNNITISTRVKIEGDGQGAISEVVLNGESIEKIIINSIGTGYTRANVTIYGTATSNLATARVILPPKYGHGHSPAVELNCYHTMIVKTIGEVDATEGGLISTDISYRQYGLLLNPHKYNNSSRVDYYTANNTLSQTLDITLESGNSYSLNDYVYQGASQAPTFSGYIVSQDNLVVKVTDSVGIVDIGALLTNGTVSRPVRSIKYPDLQPYSGDILYVSNVSKVQRALQQSEQLKLIITV